MLLAKKDKHKQVLLAKDHAWMESSEYEYETSEYYDNTTTYGLVVNDNDDQEIFHDCENFLENLIESQINHNESVVDHNDSEGIDKLIRKFNKKIAKCLKLIEKANQQNKDFENQNKDLQDKYDVLKNQATTFKMKNKELNEQMKVLIEKNNDLLAQTNVLKDQLQVKHVVVDTHVECQENYAKIEAERYEYMIRYSAYFDNDKQHRKQIANQEVFEENPNVIAPGMFKLSVSQSVSPIFVTKTSCASYGVENLDTLSSVRRSKPCGVMWMKKGSSNTVKADFAFVCNKARNALCNARINASVDVNDLFVFNDVIIRKSHVSKMPFRKNPSASLNVPYRSKLNKSLPRIMRKWLPKLQPLAKPVAKWILRVIRCSKHMTDNRALLTNFLEKFLGMVRFGNIDFTVIAGYRDVVIGSMTIKKLYYVEGLGHNLFSVGQFCDKGLEVVFQKSTCFVRNEDGVDLLTGDRSSNLYTIALNEVASNSLACLLAKASSSQSWL
nr:integrase, catalytic region, zinc finger, CCHC-type, peptidase aspartic, catalytic [Tanacetum cinerariifolium]